MFLGKHCNDTLAFTVSHLPCPDILNHWILILRIARDIARNGPVAVRAAKAAVTEGMEAPTIADAMKIERRKYQIVIPTSDRQEGLAAFREKRMPEYKGR